MKTAVIADDEPITRMNIAAMLRSIEFKTVGQAADGYDAVELCRQHRPDLALLDVKMPVFDGLTAAKTITREELAGCVVLLTAFSDRQIVEQAEESGVTGYLVKPVDERLLMPTIEVAMAQAQRLRESKKEAQKAKSRLEDEKIIRRAQLILSSREKLSQEDAYRWLRTMAMEKRMTMGELAKAIVGTDGSKQRVDKAKAVLMKKGMSESSAYKKLEAIARERSISLMQAADTVLREYGNE